MVWTPSFPPFFRATSQAAAAAATLSPLTHTTHTPTHTDIDGMFFFFFFDGRLAVPYLEQSWKKRMNDGYVLTVRMMRGGVVSDAWGGKE